MALETVTHISDLVVTNPTSTDPKSEGDNHLRNIKTALKTDFPNISGVVTKTHTQLNNTLDKTGDTMTGPLAQALGTVALPSYTFSGDTNTGMWSPGADILAWSTGGVERMRVLANGRVQLTPNNEQFALQLNNGATLNGPYIGSSGADTLTLSASSGVTMGDWSPTTGLLVKQATGLGYGTGSGGTVTQATSRTTGVTLNKPSGAITLFSTTTTAGTFASFTLTNSTIAATDGVDVCLASAATANSYILDVTAVAAGSCRIQVYNVAAVGVAEAPVIRFNVIKGASA